MREARQRLARVVSLDQVPFPFRRNVIKRLPLSWHPTRKVTMGKAMPQSVSPFFSGRLQRPHRTGSPQRFQLFDRQKSQRICDRERRLAIHARDLLNEILNRANTIQIRPWSGGQECHR